MTNHTKNLPTDLESLLTSPPGGVPDNGWVRNHNRAVLAFIRSRVGAPSNVRRSERAILSLVAGIDQYVRSNAEFIDPYTSENVVGPMLDAFGDALNLDLGRLDGGTLSEWSLRMRELVGLDETGRWVGFD